MMFSEHWVTEDGLRGGRDKERFGNLPLSHGNDDDDGLQL